MPSSGIKICHIVNQQLFCISMGEKQRQKQKTKKPWVLFKRKISQLYLQTISLQ